MCTTLPRKGRRKGKDLSPREWEKRTGADILTAPGVDPASSSDGDVDVVDGEVDGDVDVVEGEVDVVDGEVDGDVEDGDVDVVEQKIANVLLCHL